MPANGAIVNGDGNMGLRGWFATIGNASGMVIVAVVMFLCLFQLSRMHSEGMVTLRDLHDQERIFNREAHKNMSEVIGKNTEAIMNLAKEIRLARTRE